MMYSEFIEMSRWSGNTENYISYVEYTTFIEPIYVECELSKQEFIALLEETFEKLVYPVVERAIHKLSMDEKLELIDYRSDRIMSSVKAIDFKARKVAYEYMKMYLSF